MNEFKLIFQNSSFLFDYQIEKIKKVLNECNYSFMLENKELMTQEVTITSQKPISLEKPISLSDACNIGIIIANCCK